MYLRNQYQLILRTNLIQKIWSHSEKRLQVRASTARFRRVDTVEEQLSIALQKAGIRPDEDYEIERFEVIRHN